MWRTWMMAAVIAAGTVTVSAQQAQESTGQTRKYNGSVYGFFAAGACNHGYGLFAGGGGAEALLWKGISAGVEGSYQQFTDGWGFGTLTPQFGYHFINRNKPVKWDPFVTVGGGAAFESGESAMAANLGGGVTYWFKPRVGIRFEYRAQVIAIEEGTHSFRIGIAFR